MGTIAAIAIIVLAEEEIAGLRDELKGIMDLINSDQAKLQAANALQGDITGMGVRRLPSWTLHWSGWSMSRPMLAVYWTWSGLPYLPSRTCRALGKVCRPRWRLSYLSSRTKQRMCPRWIWRKQTCSPLSRNGTTFAMTVCFFFLSFLFLHISLSVIIAEFGVADLSCSWYLHQGGL